MAGEGTPALLMLAKAAGVAPYTRAPSGEYKTPSLVHRVLSVFGLSLAVILKSPLTTRWFSSHVLLANTVDDQARMIMFYLAFIKDLILVLSLPAWQFRRVREFLNSPVLQDVTCSSWWRPILPYSIVVVYFLGCAFCRIVYLVSFFTRHEDGSSEDSVFDIVAEVALLYTVFASSANMSLFAYLLNGVTQFVDDRNSDIWQAMKQAGHIPEDEIREIRRKYKDARDLTEKICWCFSAQLLSSLSTDVWFVVWQIFNQLNKTKPPTLMMVYWVDAVKSIVSIAALLLSSELLSLRSDETLSILHRFRNSRRFSYGEKEEIEEFSRQLQQQPIRITVCNVINLNCRLLLNFVGFGATYTIMLMQFQENNQTKPAQL